MTTTILTDNTRAALADPQHLLLLRMRNGGGYVERGAGASVTQLKALASKRYVVLAETYVGARKVIVGAHLTPRGERHLEALDAALAERQRREALFSTTTS